MKSVDKCVLLALVYIMTMEVKLVLGIAALMLCLLLAGVDVAAQCTARINEEHKCRLIEEKQLNRQCNGSTPTCLTWFFLNDTGYEYGSLLHGNVSCEPQFNYSSPLRCYCITEKQCGQLPSREDIPSSVNNADSNGSTPMCPTWFLFNGTGCDCGSRLHGKVQCEPQLNQISLLNFYCMTYNDFTGNIVFGTCVYSKVGYAGHLFHPLPHNVTQLNEAMCGRFNRQGQLCGQCKEGYLAPVYSYDLHCVKCTYNRHNWALYILAALGPLTIFFSLVISCRISATSATLNCFIQVSQALSAPIGLRPWIIHKKKIEPYHIVAALHGIWNLDFFRTLLPPICLNVTTLQALTLDYVIAFYPLILIAATYIFIELHAHNFRPVVWIWKPFHRCFARFRRHWDVKTSIIDAFATFILLSYMKLLSVSFDILVPTRIFNIHGEELGTHYLYYDATVEYFGTEHLPYAILAIVVLLVFVMFPLLLLLLYPCRCFQRLLTHCRLRSQSLHTFIDAFQGCYKDGTNGTRDCRYFAVAYLLLRIIIYLLYAFTLTTDFWPLLIMLHSILIIVIIIIQPYKSNIYNFIDPILLSIFLTWCASVLLSFHTFDPHVYMLSNMLTFVLYALPLVYITGVVLHWILPKRALRKLKDCFKRDTANMEESLPARLVNPELYNRANPTLGEAPYYQMESSL